ncbi:MAG: hypothetical protein CBB87_10315 [Micavibrio sp. TMED27]|nr:hypothetical protein [Micavibrio sp.]OUT90150.1 MAG: hypothetical protein CBB87_10315 [Micavibrio sp. TMED27]|tara:strand:- start:3991 stop:4299 length:309 start_codon:yes stop_codon:yes gene_type:complete
MNTLYNHSAALRHNFFAFISVCLCLYFSFHAIQGERGVLSLVAINKQVIELQAKQTDLIKVRSKLETQVSMMRPGSVNKDLLEERVRLQLGYKHSDEFTVIN